MHVRQMSRALPLGVSRLLPNMPLPLELLLGVPPGILGVRWKTTPRNIHLIPAAMPLEFLGVLLLGVLGPLADLMALDEAPNVLGCVVGLAE
jgi:hypothetical protein